VLTLIGSANLGAGYFNVGPGTVDINEGASVSDGNAVIDSGGTVTVSGTGTKWTSGANVYIGNAETGTLLISAGASVSTDGDGYGGLIGYDEGSSGKVTVTGAGSKWINLADLYVGVYGDGTLLIENGLDECLRPLRWL
jgi:T5SS/PEP-CTERM-associated repeat protein